MRITRVMKLDDARLERAAGDAGPGNFVGHAAVYDTRTLIGSRNWGFVEKIARGAFDRAIAEDDVRHLVNHNADLLLGRTASGTTKLSSDGSGLRVDTALPDTQLGRDEAVLVERGDRTQMSFSFSVEGESVRTLPDDDPEYPGMEERTVTDVKPLYDVANVTYAAYPTTDAAMRSYDVTMRSLVEGHTLSAAQKRTLIQLVVDLDPLSFAGTQPGQGSFKVEDNDDPDLDLQDAELGGKPDPGEDSSGGRSMDRDELVELRGKIDARLAVIDASAARSLDVADAGHWMRAFEARYGKVQV